MSFDPFHSDLPITEVLSDVQSKLASGNTLILNAPPGAGKSTLLPLALLDAPWLEGRKILMLEPRRLAAKGIATRMAELLGESVGERVGYRIRFETRVSERTVIEVLTEGILTRMLHSDNALEEAAIVVFDEFHERSIHADVALAFCRETQQVLRPDLRILLMSATLDMVELEKLLKAPVVVSEGRQFPVEVIYGTGADQRMMAELCAQSVLQAAQDQEGDILVFLPGQGEIKRCEELLDGKLKGFAIHPLYGTLSFGKQRAALLPDPKGRRKVVIATAIAETSLTIEGVRTVVDSGFARIGKFDAKSGLSRLETVQLSKDSADQRAGRAGRLEAGVCYRLWTRATHERLSEHRRPEILEADLASLALDMAEWGIKDIRGMTWLTPPPAGPLKQAEETLEQLSALEDGRITAHGKKMHALPCHPRLAHMLLKAEESGDLGLATDLAAILEERDPMPKETGADVNLRIEALRRHRRGITVKKKFGRIDKIASSYRKMFKAKEDNGSVDPYTTGVLLAYAYPERIASARPGNNAQFQMANGKLAMMSHRDDLAAESWLAIAHVDARDGMGKIFMASPLNPRDLAPMVEKREVVTWDTRRGGAVATLDLRIGSIVLQSKPLPDPDQDIIVAAICEAIKKEGLSLLTFDAKLEAWQGRVLSLRKWREDPSWPDVSTEALLQTAADWLAPYLNQVRKPEDLKKINLKEVLQHTLTYQQQQDLNRLAPERIEVPSGSSIKLKYDIHGAVPVLAVRLQEVFGLADTPAVNEGQTKLLLHLLSPGHKPVQITSDLRSFWDSTYFDVRKDLKSRYPKHAWPDDPWTAEAIRGAKRRKKN